MASADLAVGAAAAAATGLAALIVILAAEGPAAVAAGARELRVDARRRAPCCWSRSPSCRSPRSSRCSRPGVGPDEAVAAAGGVAGPAMGLVTLAVDAGRRGPLGPARRSTSGSRGSPTSSRPRRCRCCSPGSRCRFTVVAFAAVDRLIAPLALPLDGERAILVLLALADARRRVARRVLPRRPAPRRRLPRDRRRRAAAARDRRARPRGLGAGPRVGRRARRVARPRSGRGRPWPRTASRRAASPTCAAGSGARRCSPSASRRPRSRRSACRAGSRSRRADARSRRCVADPPLDATADRAPAFLSRCRRYLRLLVRRAGAASTSRVDRAAPERIVSLAARGPAETLPVEHGAGSQAWRVAEAATPAGRRGGRAEGAMPSCRARRVPRTCRCRAPRRGAERCSSVASRAGARPARGRGALGAEALGARVRRRIGGAGSSPLRRRNRTELLSGTVLALAILAASPATARWTSRTRPRSPRRSCWAATAGCRDQFADCSTPWGSLAVRAGRV